MGHLLETVNPQAAAAIEGIAPVDYPQIGEPLRFHRRKNDFRAGKTTFPAMCLGVNPDQGLVDLLVVFDVEDYIRQQVKQWDGENPGWERLGKPDGDIGELRRDLNQVAEDLYGENARPSASVCDALASLHIRLSKIEELSENQPAPKAKAESNVSNKVIAELSLTVDELRKKVEALTAPKKRGRPPKKSAE